MKLLVDRKVRVRPKYYNLGKFTCAQFEWSVVALVTESLAAAFHELEPVMSFNRAKFVKYIFLEKSGVVSITERILPTKL